MYSETNQLIPCIFQNFITGRVLMLGYMNDEAIDHTLKSRQVTFFSRSKNRLWTKGESSGNYLDLVSLTKDCDQDSILCQVIPRGVTCHTGQESCFANGSTTFLRTLSDVIDSKAQGTDEKSYVKSLVASGVQRVAQKVGEEGVEVALSAVSGKELPEEAADLLFHLLVLLCVKEQPIESIFRILYERSCINFDNSDLGSQSKLGGCK
jgi:phosphoribosyl-ATP pyrophosphohydrolase/phosphoribosyl-AMP cyclohydrolase